MLQTLDVQRVSSSNPQIYRLGIDVEIFFLNF